MCFHSSIWLFFKLTWIIVDGLPQDRILIHQVLSKGLRKQVATLFRQNAEKLFEWRKWTAWLNFGELIVDGG